MANVRGTTGVGEGSTPPQDPIVRDFVPSSGWSEDSDGHYLLFDLPEFKREEVKLQVNTSSHVTASGERLTSDNRYKLRFHQTLLLPPGSDIQRISGKLDGGILSVTVPKLIVQKPEAEIQKSENENTNSDNTAEEHTQETPRNDENDSGVDGGGSGVDGGGSHVDQEEKKDKNSQVDEFPEEVIMKWQKKPSQLLWAMRMMKENKQIVFTALLAFSLGVLVSRKFGSGGHVDGAAI